MADEIDIDEVVEVEEPTYLLKFAVDSTNKINTQDDRYPKLRDDGYIVGDYPMADEINGYWNNFGAWAEFLNYYAKGNVNNLINEKTTNLHGREIHGAEFTSNGTDKISFVDGVMSLREFGTEWGEDDEEYNDLVGASNQNKEVLSGTAWSYYTGTGNGIMAVNSASAIVGRTIYIFYLTYENFDKTDPNTFDIGGDTDITGANIVDTIRTVKSMPTEKIHLRRVGAICLTEVAATMVLESRSQKNDRVFIEGIPIDHLLGGTILPSASINIDLSSKGQCPQNMDSYDVSFTVEIASGVILFYSVSTSDIGPIYFETLAEVSGAGPRVTNVAEIDNYILTLKNQTGVSTINHVVSQVNSYIDTREK